MAHSFVTSFEEEIDAFRAFAKTFPHNTVLLIDTYDTIQGAHNAVIVGREMMERGERLKGVRLDSGDMGQLSKDVKKILLDAGLDDAMIFASGGFDEFKIAAVLEGEAHIDAFGVGTKMGVSADAPYHDMAYKLVQYDGRPVLKLSSGKKTLVGEKQVFRFTEKDRLIRDSIALRSEQMDGEPLLENVMEGGKRRKNAESLPVIRDRFYREFASLPDEYKALDTPKLFPVEVAPGLKDLQRKIEYKILQKRA
jgi:nicotinate phosphoribosyltransferase